jgi:hypothetical protein
MIVTLMLCFDHEIQFSKYEKYDMDVKIYDL